MTNIATQITSRFTQPRLQVTRSLGHYTPKTHIGQVITMAGSYPGETREYTVSSDGSLIRSAIKENMRVAKRKRAWERRSLTQLEKL